MARSIIEINRLRMYAYHGVEEQEREVGNEFEISVHLEYPSEIPMQNDRIEGALSYGEVARVIEQEMGKKSYLLENVVYRIVEQLKFNWPRISGGSVTVAKLHPPMKYQVENCAFTYIW